MLQSSCSIVQASRSLKRIVAPPSNLVEAPQVIVDVEQASVCDAQKMRSYAPDERSDTLPPKGAHAMAEGEDDPIIEHGRKGKEKVAVLRRVHSDALEGFLDIQLQTDRVQAVLLPRRFSYPRRSTFLFDS